MSEALVTHLEYLLREKFNGQNYRKYTIDEMKEIIQADLGEYVSTHKDSVDSLTANKIIRKIKKMQTASEILMLISEKYFSLQGMDA